MRYGTIALSAFGCLLTSISPLVEALRAEGVRFEDKVQTFKPIELKALSWSLTPYVHQQEALLAWKQNSIAKA